MPMTFTLTDEEMAKVRAWEQEQDRKHVDKALADPRTSQLVKDLMKDGNGAYYGAIGGSLTYSFAPNSVGVAVTVKHVNGEVLDLTDFGSW